MNQAIKNAIYHLGTQKQVDFMAELGGMNEEEYAVFMAYHTGKTDLYIQQDLNVDQKGLKRIEESMRTKLILAVFQCINYKMDN